MRIATLLDCLDMAILKAVESGIDRWLITAISSMIDDIWAYGD